MFILIFTFFLLFDKYQSKCFVFFQVFSIKAFSLHSKYVVKPIPLTKFHSSLNCWHSFNRYQKEFRKMSIHMIFVFYIHNEPFFGTHPLSSSMEEKMNYLWAKPLTEFPPSEKTSGPRVPTKIEVCLDKEFIQMIFLSLFSSRQVPVMFVMTKSTCKPCNSK